MRNKGFTLIELIVVIVILAILVGVTIGGVYKYVNDARINTDENNFSTISEVISTLNADDTFYRKLHKAWNSDYGGSNLRAFQTVEIVINGAYKGSPEIDFSDVTAKLASGNTYYLPKPSGGMPYVLIYALTGESSYKYAEIISKYIGSLFTDGFPKMQSGRSYKVSVSIDLTKDQVVSTECSWL